ncbi:hypothetical protein M427DRAFT_155238 [Gonapodya prolifera JEL478]|uniref:Uncharacterized protein n=1 Tax=Gonapodya prolifera (strain JEL478) TaxID=1344416 RepID=A0A139AFD4_GONPJ|nr:hypothetical protein M427DRAFT_155238 [Gonapodya prolifera JEL478]|eukprot:KXS15497.1 hypothetical protein M427DRAFT_155238 [Gonapodya prolifera JEL478]
MAEGSYTIYFLVLLLVLLVFSCCRAHLLYRRRRHMESFLQQQSPRGTELREQQPEEFLPSYQEVSKVVVPGVSCAPDTEGSSAHPDPISHESGTPGPVTPAPSPPSLTTPPDAALSRSGPGPEEHIPEPSAPVLSISLPSIPPPSYEEIHLSSGG